MNSMVTCVLSRHVDDCGAACCCYLDSGLRFPHPHRCGQSGQQKADKDPSVLIITILQLAAYNKKIDEIYACVLVLDRTNIHQRSD